MRSRFLGLLAIAALLMSMLPSTARAAVFQDTTCQGYLVNQTACFYEDANLGGDNVLISQFGNVSNLGNVSVTTGDKHCFAFPVFGDYPNWNDCITSMTVQIAAGHALCLYRDANYSTLLQRIPGPRLNSFEFSGSNMNDSITSFRWDGC